MHMKTAAAILAGGSGRRFGGTVPKQFVKVSGRMIIEYTVDAFEENSLINEICVVVNPEYMDIMNAVVKKNGWKKLAAVLPGGKERSDSSLAAVNYYRGQDMNILIHDAARPKVSQRIISEAAAALESFPAVCTACPASDTIAVADSECETIAEIPPRRLMYHVQTPQGFRLDVIAGAYDAALKDPDFSATDDCGVVRKYLPEIPVKIIEGSPENIKITRADDIKCL